MYKPFNIRSGKKQTSSSRTSYLVRRILITNVLSVLVVIFTYLWVVYIISNANSFWSIFRGKDIYVVKDIVPPVTPYINPIPEATQGDSINLSGKSEAGVKITLNVNNTKTQETTSDAEGQFSFENIPVGFSTEEITVTAQDQAGNTSKPSQAYRIQKDTTSPEFTITAPAKDGVTYKSTGRTYAVTGTTEPDVSIKVNEQSAMVSSTGDFHVSLRLEEGNNKMKITATDKAGNTTEKFTNVKYEKIE